MLSRRREGYGGDVRKYLIPSLLGLLLAGPAVAARLIVLFTNDVRGRIDSADLLGSRRAGGGDALAELVIEERAELGPQDDLIVVDSGDFMLGSLRLDTWKGAPAIQVMNRVGYTAAGLGNHEFDLGMGVIRIRSTEARFPFLCANLSHSQAATGGPRILGSKLVKLPRSGLRIGLTAAVDPEGMPEDLPFIAPLPALAREAERLADRGAELRIALTHLGVDLERQVAAGRGFDLVVGGHFPAGRVEERIGNTLLLQAQARAQEVGRVEIPLEGGKPVVAKAKVSFLPWSTRPVAGTAPDLGLDEYPVDRRTLATSSEAWSMDATEQWVLDQILHTARRHGVKPALAAINAGALRGAFPAGAVTATDVHRVAPFENHLVHLELPVEVVQRLRTETPTARKGALIWRLADGATLPAKGRVGVVVNDYLARGGDRYPEFVDVPRQRVLESTVVDAISHGLATAGPRFSPPTRLR